MEKTTLKDTLRALAQDSGKRTKIGQLREVLGDIQAAQAAGVSNAKIVDALNAEHGLGLSLKTFETMLYRLRKERAGGKSARQLPTPAAAPSPNLRHDEDPPASVPAPEPADPTPADDPPPAGLTRKQASELKADQYLSPNPLLKRLAGKEKK